MHPIVIQLGTFAIRGYGVMAAIGFLMGCLLISINRKYAKMNQDQATSSMFVAMVSGIIGARIFYVIQFFDLYRDNPMRIIRIDQGGLVFYGGFILAILSLIIFCRIQKIDTIRLLDIFAPATAIMHACGRIGCFLNGCCFGNPTTSKLGIHFPPGSEASLRYPDQAIHPVQLYEAGEMAILCILFFFLVRRAKRGIPMSCYIALYGVLRFVNELFRGDNAKILDLFTPAQLIGLVAVPLGIGLTFYFIVKHNELQDTDLPN